MIGIADDGIGQARSTAALAERRMPVPDPDRHRSAPVHLRRGRRAGARHQRRGAHPARPQGPVQRQRRERLPTLLSNAETYAQLAIAARLGPWEYNAVGIRRGARHGAADRRRLGHRTRPWWSARPACR